MPFGVTDFGFGVAFTLKDEFSKTAQRIRGSFSGLNSEVSKHSGKIGLATSKMQEGMKNMGGAIVGGALIAGIRSVSLKAADMSDVMADTAKTTGITGDALFALRDQLEKIDTRTSVKDLLGIAKAGGALGIASKDIYKFTESVDKLFVALGDQYASAEELAMNLTKMRLVLKDVKTDDVGADLMHIGNALNFMGQNSSAVEKDIADVVSRMGGLGQAMGMNSSQIFGVSTALLELGVHAEVAGTNFPLMLQRMAKDSDKFAAAIGMDAAKFKDMVNKDVVGAIAHFATEAKKMAPNATSMAALLDQVGLEGGRLSEIFFKLGGNTDLMKQRIDEAGKALQKTDSIMQEFGLKNNTWAALIEKNRNAWEMFTTKIGEALIPILDKLLVALTWVMQKISDFVSTPLGKWVTIAVIALVGLVAVFSVLSFVIPMVSAAFTLMGVAIDIALGPIGLIVLAITGLIILLAKATDWISTGSDKWRIFGTVILYALGPIGQAVSAILNLNRGLEDFNALREGEGDVKEGFGGFWQKVGGVFTAVGEIWDSFTTKGFSLSLKTKEALEKMGILKFVENIGIWFVRVKRLWVDFKQSIVDLKNTVVDAISGMWDWFTKLGDRTDWLGSLFRTLVAPFVMIKNVLVKVWDFLSAGFDMIAEKIGAFIDRIKAIKDAVFGWFDDREELSRVGTNGEMLNVITDASKIRAMDDAAKLRGMSVEEKKVQESNRQKAGSVTTSSTTIHQGGEIKNQILIDGQVIDVISDKVNEKQKLEDSTY